MTEHPDIAIVCDHGRKGDGPIEHEHCDLVAPIIWADDDQGWLPQAPAIATYLADTDQPRAGVGMDPNRSRIQPGTRRDGWTRLHFEFVCPQYSEVVADRACTRQPVRVRNNDLQRVCELLAAGDPVLIGALVKVFPHGISFQLHGAVALTMDAVEAACDTPGELPHSGGR